MIYKERIALIGSREPYDNIVRLSVEIGKFLSDNECSGFSGGASGMDSHFMQEFSFENSFIIVPERKPKIPKNFIIWDELDDDIKIRSYLQAKRVCPDIDNRPLYHQKLFARNSCQVLGVDCKTPVDRVIFWAKESKSGLVSGGTRIAVRIAREYDIPCHNLFKPDVRKQFEEMIGYKNRPTNLFDFMEVL